MIKRMKLHGLSVTLFVVLMLPISVYAAQGTNDTAGGSQVLPPSGPLGEVFASASNDYGIPQDLLLAIGYYETRLEQQGTGGDSGNDAEDGGYGVMHLVERPDNSSLADAAALIGQPADALKQDAQMNIRGAAALMQSLMQQQGLNIAPDAAIEEWQLLIKAYSEAIHPGVANLYVQEIYTLLRNGFSRTTSSGETLSVAARNIDMPPSMAANAVQPTSDDYPPARWIPANPNNYTVANRPYDQAINRIIIHDTEGSYASAIAWFQNPSSQVSAQYVIRSNDGEVTQMVRNKDIAWQAGNWSYNQRSIGIEHEGYVNDPSWYTEAMYQSSAALARNLTDRYAIPRDRRYIISHKEVPNQANGHTDPGPNWNFTYYMSLLRGDSPADTVVDNLDSPFHPVPTIVDPANYWFTAQGETYGSNAYYTYSVANQSQSSNYAVWRPNIPTAGSYDIYAFIPYVSNGNADTSNAVYTVGFSGGNVQQVAINQDYFTDGLAAGGLQDSRRGQWAAIGRFYLDAGTTNYVKLTDVTGENNKNVWFDAMRFIPIDGYLPPPATATPVPTDTPPPAATATPAEPTPTSECPMYFPDVPTSYWAYSYINHLYCQNIMSGYNDGLFYPRNTMNRAQFAKLVAVSMGWPLVNPETPTYVDVGRDHWAYSFIETVSAQGALTGFPDGTFHPGYNVTRAQVAIVIVRAHNWPRVTPVAPSFADVPPSHWAYVPIETAAAYDVISGYGDGRFGPDDTSTRDQLAKIIYQSLRVQ